MEKLQPGERKRAFELLQRGNEPRSIDDRKAISSLVSESLKAAQRHLDSRPTKGEIWRTELGILAEKF